MKSLFGGKEGEYYKIPLPYGYNIFYNLGDAAEAMVNSVSRGRKDELPTNLAGSFMTAFSPIGVHGGDSKWEQAILSTTPTVALPAAELGFNTNHFGSPIIPQDFPGAAEKSNAAKSFRSTKESYKAITEWLNEATGGSEYKSGGIDVSPTALEYVTEYALGGLLRFTTRTAETASAAYDAVETGDPMTDIPSAALEMGRAVVGLSTPENLDTRNIPFRRRLEGEVGNFGDQATYYDNRQEVINAVKDFKEARGMAAKKEADDRFNGVRRLDSRKKASDKLLKGLRNQRDRIESNESLSSLERDKKLRDIEERMDRVYDKFNGSYNEFLNKREL